MSDRNATLAGGISARHSKSCHSRDGGHCNCKPTFQAAVWSNRDRKRIRKTFPTLGAAKSWRRDALTALDHGTMRAATSTTLQEAA